jgi:hypothetical protein
MSLNRKRLFFSGLAGTGKSYLISRLNPSANWHLLDPGRELVALLVPQLQEAVYQKNTWSREFGLWIGRLGRGWRLATDFDPTRVLGTAFFRFVGSLISPNNAKIQAADWTKFGNDDFWVNAAVAGTSHFPKDQLVTIDSVRADVDQERLRQAGWTHVHVLCDPATRLKRILTKETVLPDTSDQSEKLGHKLDRLVMENKRDDPNFPDVVVWTGEEQFKPGRALLPDAFVSWVLD